jgi:phosphonate transport system substrate-binding protein
MFIPYVDQQTIMTHTEELVKYLEKSLSQKMLGKDEGFFIQASIPTFYIAVVEAFGTGRADLAAMTTFSYLLTKDQKKYPVEAILTVDRDPDGQFYKGAIIARADSSVKSFQDLNGKKFAFSDPASTSGFILPSKLFKDKGIKLEQTVFAGRHDSVVSMVYQGQVDAGAIFYSSPKIRTENGKTTRELRDARGMVLVQYPDVEEKIKIIGFTEEAPTEPWVLRTNIYSDPAKQAKLRKAIVDSVVEFTSSDAGKELMRILVRGERVLPADDARYDGIREVIRTLNFDITKLVK